MIWYYLDTGDKSGRFNMEFDVELAKNCKNNEGFFRVYRWKPFCISLGANQKFEDIDLPLAKSENIDIVKRPTGGRAILHAEELTYSIVVPTKSGFTPKELYKRISEGLSNGLSMYDQKLKEAMLEEEQPDFSTLLKQPSGMLCFASTAKSEVKYNGKKLIGSAQRKMNNSILQHGSILVGTFHRILSKFVHDKNQIQNFDRELQEKTIELESILGKTVDFEKLKMCLRKGFELEFDVELVEKNYEELLKNSSIDKPAKY